MQREKEVTKDAGPPRVYRTRNYGTFGQNAIMEWNFILVREGRRAANAWAKQHAPKFVQARPED